ncbi:hypothetical protein VIGAN_02165500 [Vigna angularis var. angularis]|uniref:Bulb-type lectin domain-containing protein n=1 Tax=Vigna angularis var. angularis TaxID=157739 RepID=A0A0S3RDX4_PHAAN|nr:hypothetical protein VIGAN_02165500 [Vigna angularis var. angularis]
METKMEEQKRNCSSNQEDKTKMKKKLKCRNKFNYEIAKTPERPPQGNLVSSNATFELGFFSPGEKSGGKYLGIWYHGLKQQTVVWVANREDLVADSSGVFRIAEDGNLVVEDAFKSRCSSELGPSRSLNRTLQLLESGNRMKV